jgi:hypothetical protein
LTALAELLRTSAGADRARSARRRAVRRRRGAALLTLIAIATLAVWALGGSTAARHIARHTPPRTSAARVRTRAQPAVPSPGSLPQTHAYPSGTSAQFKALMAQLWAGVVHDSLSAALPAFFPEGAYVQLKAISSASSDWTDRLVHDYGLDIAAAHALLRSGAGRARLTAVEVSSSYGHWVPPGVCYNRIGYYELPNARVVYSEAGQTRSFGIASMISWRGVWYVVHFGAILRASDVGMVDDPAVGAGSSAYSGTC